MELNQSTLQWTHSRLEPRCFHWMSTQLVPFFCGAPGSRPKGSRISKGEFQMNPFFTGLPRHALLEAATCAILKLGDLCDLWKPIMVACCITTAFFKRCPERFGRLRWCFPGFVFFYTTIKGSCFILLQTMQLLGGVQVFFFLFKGRLPQKFELHHALHAKWGLFLSTLLCILHVAALTSKTFNSLKSQSWHSQKKSKETLSVVIVVHLFVIVPLNLATLWLQLILWVGAQHSLYNNAIVAKFSTIQSERSFELNTSKKRCCISSRVLCDSKCGNSPFLLILMMSSQGKLEGNTLERVRGGWICEHNCNVTLYLVMCDSH